MSDVDLIIKIPEEKAERLLAQMRLDRNFGECKITQLPKGCGDLIDSALEQAKAEIAEDRLNDVLDKIKNEISLLDNLNPNYLSDGVIAIDKHEVYKIIDKYKAGKRGNDQNNEQINKMYD